MELLGNVTLEHGRQLDMRVGSDKNSRLNSEYIDTREKKALL